MAGYSIQDIETRLQVIEDKVTYIMDTMGFEVPSKIIGGKPRRLTLKERYLEAKQAEAAQRPFSNVRERVKIDETLV